MRAERDSMSGMDAHAPALGARSVATRPPGPNGIHLRENAIHLRTRFPTGAFFRARRMGCPRHADAAALAGFSGFHLPIGLRERRG